MGKVAVCVIALYVGEGAVVPRIPASPAMAAAWRVIPLRLCTKDHYAVNIDRVTDIRRQASTKVGGLGNRYTCLITAGDVQREVYLYKDEDDWFLEEDYFGIFAAESAAKTAQKSARKPADFKTRRPCSAGS